MHIIQLHNKIPAPKGAGIGILQFQEFLPVVDMAFCLGFRLALRSHAQQRFCTGEAANNPALLGRNG